MMGGPSATAGAGANLRPDARVGKDRQPRRPISAVMRVARRLWPRNTPAELSVRTGAHIRSSERQLAGRHRLSGGALAGLIRSEEGFEFLAAVMGEAPPRWWRRLLAMSAVAEVRARQAADMRALKQLREAIDAEALVSATVERAEDALCVPGADLRRADLVALRAHARPRDRAMDRAAAETGRAPQW
jgi:hypothetical protein